MPCQCHNIARAYTTVTNAVSGLSEASAKAIIRFGVQGSGFDVGGLGSLSGVYVLQVC